MSLQSGAAVAVVAALGANLGKVCQKRGTENLPVLEMKAEVVKLYLRSPWWLAGLLLDVGGAILTLAALALAPVSVVQPILGCGLACVAIFSHYLTADRLRASDWAACLLCVAGTIGIGLTTVEGSGAEEMLLASGVIIIATFGALATACSALAERKQLSLEIAASVSAGICFGLSACCTRCGMSVAAEVAAAGGASAAYLSPLAAVLGIAGSIFLSSSGFVAQTKGLKDGRALAVVAYSNLVALLVAVVFGVFALSEPLPTTSAGLAGRAGALLCLVIGSLALGGGGGGGGGGPPTPEKAA